MAPTSNHSLQVLNPAPDSRDMVTGEESSRALVPPKTPVVTVSTLADLAFEVARIAALIDLGNLDSVKLREYAGRVTQNVKDSVPEDFPYSELHAAARALVMIAGSESLETNEGWSGKKPIACLEWLSLSIEYILQFSKTSFVAECGGTFWQNSFSRCRKTFYDVERLNDDKGANSYPNKQERVTEYELQTPIRLIGAELEFLFHRIDKQQIAENNQDWAGDYLELPRLYNHLLCFISDLRLGESHKERTPYSVAAIAGFSLIGALTRQFESRLMESDVYKEAVWKVYQELSQVTVFRGYPERCRELQLTLLEFNTDFSGLPQFLIPTVQKLDSAVLIDPSRKIQQDGLGREMLTSEAEKLLRSTGSRLFIVKSGRDPVGYDMFLPNAPSNILPGTDLIHDLVKQGILKDEKSSNIGFLRSVVVPPGKRLTFAKAGVNAYDLLDDLMGQVAIFENCESMVCTVRVGENPNVSRKAHERRRWSATGYIIRDSVPGAAPLEIFVRDPHETILLPLNFFPTNKTPPLGYRPHFNPYRPEEIDFEIYEQSTCLPDREATERVTKEFGDRYKVHSYYGSLQRYITVQASSLLFNLHQLRPGFDYWYLTSSGATGTLDECIEQINKGLFQW